MLIVNGWKVRSFIGDRPIEDFTEKELDKFFEKSLDEAFLTIGYIPRDKKQIHSVKDELN